MSDLNLASFDDAKKFIETVVAKGLQDNFAKDGHIVPVAFLFASCAPDGTPLDEVTMIPVAGIGVLQSEEAKDYYAHTLKMLVEKTKACGIATAAESWTHDNMDFYLAEREKGVEPENIPGVKEVVHVSLQHSRAKSSAMYEAVITRDAEGKGTLGPLVFFSRVHPQTGERYVFDGTLPGVKEYGRFDGLMRSVS